ncbi:MAG: magnesium transporter [Candidatus Omnitrophica bacterium]|nr:magnesium transporter [Candidatus Omnitrophota bacterium]
MKIPIHNPHPWIRLKELIDFGDEKAINSLLDGISPSETARAVGRLDAKRRKRLLTLLRPTDAADVLQDLPDEQAADLIENMSTHQAAQIVAELPSEEQADILSDVNNQDAQAILEDLPADEAKKTRELLQYPENSAGGLMTIEYVSYREGMTVGEVTDDLQKNVNVYADYHIQYTYVISNQGHLQGVLRMRDLPLSGRQRPVNDIMIHNPSFVYVDAPLEELIQIFQERSFLGIPVVRRDKFLVGVVRRDEVLTASAERDSDSFLKASGIVGGEELRSMPSMERTRRRLSWLIINIVLNLLAASVIAFYQDTLGAVIALAVFLPIISDMSGSAGNQAVAVSIRELTLGHIKPNELARVLLKEAGIGLINGVVVGGVLGFIAYLWQGNPYFGLVVGGALAINTVVSVCLGGVLPLIAKFFRQDPALSSSLILTTITDMCGFFLALFFAKQMLPLIG